MYLARRVARLLTSPREEWQTIAAERDDVAAICQSYVAVLALIPAGAPLVGIAGALRHLGGAALTTELTAAMVTWALAIGGTVVPAVILEKAGPALGMDADLTQTFKLVAYAATPCWLAGAAYAFDAPGLVIAGGLWSVWLLYLGAAPVARVLPARAVPFTAIAVATILVANAALRAVFAFVRIPYLGY